MQEGFNIPDVVSAKHTTAFADEPGRINVSWRDGKARRRFEGDRTSNYDESAARGKARIGGVERGEELAFFYIKHLL